MSYRDFDIALVLKKFRINWIQAEETEMYPKLSQEFFQRLEFSPSSVFTEEFTFSLKIYRLTAVHSEALLNSHLILPFLRELSIFLNRKSLWREF